LAISAPTEITLLSTPTYTASGKRIARIMVPKRNVFTGSTLSAPHVHQGKK
jgi:hypothetical protein